MGCCKGDIGLFSQLPTAGDWSNADVSAGLGGYSGDTREARAVPLTNPQRAYLCHAIPHVSCGSDEASPCGPVHQRIGAVAQRAAKTCGLGHREPCGGSVMPSPRHPSVSPDASIKPTIGFWRRAWSSPSSLSFISAKSRAATEMADGRGLGWSTRQPVRAIRTRSSPGIGRSSSPCTDGAAGRPIRRMGGFGQRFASAVVPCCPAARGGRNQPRCPCFAGEAVPCASACLCASSHGCSGVDQML